MEEQNTQPQPAKSRKFLSPALWIITSALFCASIAIILAPRVNAQARGEQTLSGQYISIIRNVFDFIQRNYVDETDPNKLFEGAMTGMLNSLGDPYTVFLPESEMNDINDTTQGSFGGIGLYVSKQVRSDGKPAFLEVSSPMEDTPGWRAGINAGDLILQIDGESTEPLSSDEAVARLRGPPGTEVNLIIRRGERLEFPVTIVRAVIEVPTVKHDMIGSLGYLKLISFTPMTIERSREAISDFQSRGYTGVILDLRNNYGGLLNSAVSVSNLFLEGGVVVTTKSRMDSGNQVYNARGRAMVGADIPVIVLINRGSASASEIVAGALKDRGRAYLVGETSYGKGSVQQVYPLSNAGFKITIARYYTPSDASIDAIGIPPDREVIFQEYPDADAGKLGALINSGAIVEFIRDNPEASASQISAFAAQLNREYGIETSLLRRLIRNEQTRRTVAPVYDLEYDVQLQEAVRILREENFTNLMRTTKTLKAIQEEALQKENFAVAS